MKTRYTMRSILGNHLQFDINWSRLEAISPFFHNTFPSFFLAFSRIFRKSRSYHFKSFPKTFNKNFPGFHNKEIGACSGENFGVQLVVNGNLSRIPDSGHCVCHLFCHLCLYRIKRTLQDRT